MSIKDEEIIISIITSSLLMLFMIVIIIIAIIKYQKRARRNLYEMNNLKIKYQEETIKALLEKEEQTLTRISQEIHDNIGQILSLVKLNLNTLKIEDCPELIKNKILTSKDLIGKAISDLRLLSKSFNSQHLSQGYLSDSLKNELNIINKSDIYETSITVEGKEKAFNPQKQLIIFRIVQEALNNIIKHAKASQIYISLNYGTEQLDLLIKDDGVGFNKIFYDSAKPGKLGTGIGNMENRAKIIGGFFEIQSIEGKGTSVHLSVPID